MLQNKNIVLGISGGIAAYKACDIVSKLKKLNANVDVVMTQAATEFITPLTLESLSQNKVTVDMFEKLEHREIEHISLAQKADLFIIAPATANIIGKLAAGIADDMLSTTVMATKAPVLIAPAMNTNMYTNSIVQANIEKLKGLGFRFIPPASGRLACGAIGEGILAPVETIIAEIEKLLTRTQDFSEKKFLITAGPTREAIDPVRFISNHSSGKMGYALAEAAVSRGADVTLISGPVALQKPFGLDSFISVESAAEMHRAVMDNFKKMDVIIMAAAVGDFTPKQKSAQKIKKGDSPLTLELERTTDILGELGKVKEKQFLVGFAAETQNVPEYARGKLIQKNLNLIVANDLTQEGAGFGTETNIVKIIDASGKVEDLPLMSKLELSHRILDRIQSKMEMGKIECQNC
jgi:phosphopantothenoylcysteine decarboxylase/phosphopantothenate--cysteine ligase